MALEINKIHCMDALTGLRQMDDQSVNCIVTSPPYWNQRDYGVEGRWSHNILESAIWISGTKFTKLPDYPIFTEYK